MKVRLNRDCQGENGPLKKGAIIDHPKAEWLMKTGVADPFDADAIRAHRKLRKQLADQFDAASPEPENVVKPLVPEADPAIVVPPPPPPPFEGGGDLMDSFSEPEAE